MDPMIRNSLISCLAVLAAVTLAECSLLHAKEGYLVGEDTPVWLAERPDSSKPVTYTRLEQGMVKQALDYWKLMQASGGFPVRKARSVDDINYTKPNVSIVSTEAEGQRFVAKRSTDGKVLYPSVLVVVDYDHFHPMTEENKEHTIKERILYALAFWNSVDIELRHIQSPRVPLRITGIVITRDRKASPYINNDEYYYSLVHSLTPMLKYWQEVADTNEDFPAGSYDIVAHMTDSHPYREAGYSMYTGIASPAPPCNLPGGVAGVIAYDDLAFLGIHTAVEKMTNVFGDDSLGSEQYTYDRKKWTPATLEKISSVLGGSGGECMSAPKEHHPPGKPVVPVMAGELLPRGKQCEASGFSRKTWHCWTPDFWGLVTSTCEYLKCSDTTTSITCKYSNPTLDGTFCNNENTKICVAGSCVDKE